MISTQVTNQVVCSGRLGGCDYVDIKRIRRWDRACLGATLAAFVGMHLDILRRVRAFTKQKGSHRTWKEGGGRINAMMDAIEGKVWRCDLTREMKSSGGAAFGGFKGKGTIYPLPVEKA